MMRKYVIFGFALATFIGSLAAVFGTIRDRDFLLRGYVNPAANAELPFRTPRLGVNAELTQYSVEALHENFQQMRAANIIWVRQIFRWDEIEPEKSVFHWDVWDTLVTAAAEYPDIYLVAVLTHTPAWARTPHAPDNPTAPPDNPADFADFASAFAQRYHEVIDYYEIWDEPNLKAAWGGLEPQPANYMALLQAAYQAIHSADSSAVVISGGLAPTVEKGPDNLSDILYLQRLYALGANAYMDGVGAKPHGFNASPLDRVVDEDTLNFSRVIALREEMVRRGDAKKAIWASSWGWNSLPAQWQGAPSIWGSVSEQQRIDFTLSALERVTQEWPWLAGMMVQHWQPTAAPDDPIWGFSLITPDNQPTALWTALAQQQTEATAANGLYHPVNPFARYSGVWTFSPLGADIGWLNDSQLTFNFTGTNLALLLRKDDYVAYLYPTIDGEQANATPHDADGNAYVILTSGSRAPETELVPIAHKLDNTQHTLRVIADRGWDRWALAGYAVGSSDLAAPFNRQRDIALLTAVVTFASVLVSAQTIHWRSLLGRYAKVWHGLTSTAQIIISVVTSIALMLGMLLTWPDQAAPHILRRDQVQIGLAIATAGAIYLNPGFIITVLALLFLFFIIYNRLDLGLMLIIFFAPFFLFPVELYKFAFPMVELLTLVTAAAWLLRLLRQYRETGITPVKLTFLDRAVISWLILGFISLTWADRLPTAITELRTMMIEPVLCYAMIRTIPLDRGALLRLVDALLLAGVIVALAGLFIYLNPETRITAEGGAQRMTSVYGSPNNVGLFLGRCLPFLVAFILVKTDQRRRIATALSLILISIAAVLSQSVGALFVGIPASIIAVIVLAWGKRAWKPLVGLAFLGVLLFGVALQFPRFARALDLTEGTNFFRIRVWQSAVEIIQDHPITGIGLDQFLYAFRGQYMRPDAEAEPNLSHPHNVILDFWVRLGIFGVISFGLMQIAFWKNALKCWRLWKDSQGIFFAISLGICGSMVNLLAHGLVDNSVYVVDLAYVFIFLLAASVGLPNIRAIDEGLK